MSKQKDKNAKNRRSRLLVGHVEHITKRKPVQKAIMDPTNAFQVDVEEVALPPYRSGYREIIEKSFNNYMAMLPGSIAELPKKIITDNAAIEPAKLGFILADMLKKQEHEKPKTQNNMRSKKKTFHKGPKATKGRIKNLKKSGHKSQNRKRNRNL